jgi:CheY-like chemotaxis protein
MPPALLLVVDDGPDIGLLVQRLARCAPPPGQEVVSRTDAGSAWEYLLQTASGRKPDLVLLDLNLPDLPGVELCRRLRATPELRNVPLALLTHWDLGSEIAAGLEAGARFVVCKDLLTRPDAWQVRIAEILTAADVGPEVVPPSREGRLPAVTAVATLRQALRHPTVRFLGPEVLGVLVLRGLEKARCPWPATELLHPSGSLSEPAAVSPAVTETLAALARALVEQLWCVLGTEATAPFRAAVAAALEMEE